jgi:hypothetical protein
MFVNPLPGVPNVESPFFEQIFTPGDYDDETLGIARSLNRDGFAVFDFPDPEFDAVADRIKAALRPTYNWEQWLETGYERGAGMRQQDAWQSNKDVKRLAVNAQVVELLSRLYGRAAKPFQTLNFPVGTQQHFHSDSVHFSSAPPRFMCGVWVALEDIDQDAGPLLYYPGSHKWPVFSNEHIGVCAAENNFEPGQAMYEPLWESLVELYQVKPQRFFPKKGQALIWAANLLHGGDKQNDKNRTRWSQVTHYYFENCAYYTPMRSDPFYGSIDFREPQDISTGKTTRNMVAGHEIDRDFIKSVRSKVDKGKKLPEGFNDALYLAANPDVKAAGVDARDHYLTYGHKEGRRLRP